MASGLPGIWCALFQIARWTSFVGAGAQPSSLKAAPAGGVYAPSAANGTA